ncbi:methyltransferase domain-containing protein [Agrobacterium sp. AGB01]|uniref:class I SAM-dependent methyltransferase n=1 Tax=Agrobacterium sp. AGB01 TaxID=2769302 RepID=UPI001785D70F|nr:methyltransferase domain-containing protein [Agrobacterium sp. AGB01]MBD9390584.1 methyltransferase domain-containing protein [Agrobacterium sp. AGB01]
MSIHTVRQDNPRREQQQKAYRFWAPMYDEVYGYFLKSAQRELASRAGSIKGHVLEIGVGTGLVLPLYPRECQITGIDISEEMLVRARSKIREHRLSHVKELHAMDACNMSFEDASFDTISLPFVITLIPNTEGLLDECARVLKPKGQIVIVSKINKTEGTMRRLQRAVSPIAKSCGLSSAFDSASVEAWVANNPSFKLVENTTLPPIGFFRLMHLRRSG